MREPTILEATAVERDGHTVYEPAAPPGWREALRRWMARTGRKLRFVLLGMVAVGIALLTLLIALPLTLLALLLGRPRGPAQGGSGAALPWQRPRPRR